MVAETLNVRRAAERLSLSQPALTRQIQILEQELGCDLLVREKKRIRLSSAGDYLVRRGGRLMLEVARLEREMRQAWKSGQGALMLGYTEAVMAAFLPSLLKTIRSTRPEWNIRLHHGHSEGLERELVAGTLDAALVSYPSDHAGLDCREVAVERLGVVLPDEHPLAIKQKVPLRALRDEIFVLFPYRDNPRLFGDILHACRESGFAPRQIEETDSRMLAVNQVAAGVGVALLSEKLSHSCPSGTVFRKLAGQGIPIRHYLLTPCAASHPLNADFLTLVSGWSSRRR